MTHTDTACMYLAAMQHPGHQTICRFRFSHLEPIKDIFSQVVTVCKEMCMLGVGNISLIHKLTIISLLFTEYAAAIRLAVQSQVAA